MKPVLNQTTSKILKIVSRTPSYTKLKMMQFTKMDTVDELRVHGTKLDEKSC